MKIIRWWGLALFFGLIIIFGLLWYFLAPSLIKNSLQQLGSEALGAKLEISSVELSLRPPAVTLNQLRATDPNNTMQNIVDAEKIHFELDMQALLWKKFLIQELVISGVRSGTPRQQSGALEGGRKTTQLIEQSQAFKIPDAAEVDVKQLVAQADLITLKRVASLKSTQQQLTEKWQNALDPESFKGRIDNLSSEYQRLSERAKKDKLNILKDRSEWKALKRQISQERKLISGLKDDLKQDQNTLSAQLKSIQQGPSDDTRALLEKLGQSVGIENFSEKLLTPQYQSWLNQLVSLSQSIAPPNSSNDSTQNNSSDNQTTLQIGEKVYFSDQHLYPEIWIKKLHIDGSDANWQLQGGGSNFAYLPWRIEQPLRFDLNFSQIKDRGATQIKLESQWKSADSMLTHLDSKITQWPVHSMPLIHSEQLQWQLESGLLNADLNAEVDLNQINLRLSISIDSPKVITPKALQGWQQSLMDAINKQPQFNLQLTATGSIDAPTLTLSSDLDKLFKQVVSEKLKQGTQALKEKVQQAIQDRVGDTANLQSFEKNFSQWQSQLDSSDDLLKALTAKLSI